MAKMDAKEYGKRFLEELIALYPADQQQAVRDILSRAPDPVVVNVGEHILRQDDYSAAMNDVKALRGSTEAWRTQLSTWKAGVDAELAEGKAAKDRLAAMDAGGGKIINPDGGTGDEPPKIDLSGFMKKEDIESRIAQAMTQAQAYTTSYGAYMANLSVAHLKEFDEVLDTGALVAFCRENNVQIDRGGYEAFVKSKREDRSKKQHDDELKAAEDRGFRRGQSESSGELPFPTSGGSVVLGEHRTLAGLKDKDKVYDKSTAVARAVATYNEEQRKRNST